MGQTFYKLKVSKFFSKVISICFLTVLLKPFVELKKKSAYFFLLISITDIHTFVHGY